MNTRQQALDIMWRKSRRTRRKYRRIRCLEWRGFTHKGYGRLRCMRVKWRVHRLAWTLLRGPIPEGQHVLHRCDNPACWEVRHLFLGTQTDNMRDCIAKGRHAKARRKGT